MLVNYAVFPRPPRTLSYKTSSGAWGQHLSELPTIPYYHSSSQNGGQVSHPLLTPCMRVVCFSKDDQFPFRFFFALDPSVFLPPFNAYLQETRTFGREVRLFCVCGLHLDLMLNIMKLLEANQVIIVHVPSGPEATIDKQAQAFRHTCLFRKIFPTERQRRLSRHFSNAQKCRSVYHIVTENRYELTHPLFL